MNDTDVINQLHARITELDSVATDAQRRAETLDTDLNLERVVANRLKEDLRRTKAENARLQAYISELEEMVKAAEETLDDEEAAHQDTLRLLTLRTSEMTKTIKTDITK